MGTLTKWFFFTLLFSAVPYLVTVGLRRLESPDAPLFHPSKEILFIAIVTTSAALGELWGAPGTGLRGRRHAPEWELVLLAGVISSCIFYGAYVQHGLASPGREVAIDCGIIAEWRGSSAPDAAALRAAWTAPCEAWYRTEQRLGSLSVWMAVIWSLISTGAVAQHARRRKR